MNVVKKQRGFTLMELMIVITIIVLLAVTLVPSVVRFIRSGAEASAQNMLNGLIMSTRARAIESQQYVALHIQKAETDFEENVFYAAIFEYKQQLDLSWKFNPLPGYQPRKLPEKVAFGKLVGTRYSLYYVNNQGTSFQNIAGNEDDFTSLTIVFDKTGSVVKYPKDDNGNPANVLFNASDSLFVIPSGAGTRNVKLWDDNTANAGGAGEPGVSALVRFNYEELKELADNGGDLNNYLKQNGKLTALNALTGQISN